ncbi:hypothetical protein FZEAL_3754 [Fusarium zealandicum]|uniref:BZIP transcription factor n=1 Tax=Fusarium zealandicum TaxID=1053134 RepID=A0A8H4UNR1_9HYPO|nr:hypothetical protein FZEAL_3754 [Fusarium zealandicum]
MHNHAEDPRRVKKRELDRKAQRLSRERTKSRIAQLEAMVESLRQSDTNAQIASLMDQLSKVTKERDDMLQVLTSLGTTIQRHLDAPAPAGSSRTPVGASTQATISLGLMGPEISQETPGSSSETSALAPWDLAPAQPQVTNCLGNETWDYAVSCSDQFPPAMAMDNTIMGHAGGELIPLPELLPNVQMSEEDVIIPTPAMTCPCSNPNSCSSDRHPRKPRNIWRAANETLKRLTKLSSEEIIVEDLTSEDTPVRAVLEGWDSVDRAGKMSSSWRKLRHIDETCFRNCPNTERLAILTIMHLLLTYHGESSLERRSALPRWLWMRPSQALAHSYAIDFFVWPGIRERFVFSQHQYCTNLFWDLFQSNLKILWPYDFRDTYMQNARTGKYQLSPLFEERLRNINSWTMSPDFFTQFPELYEDIPSYLGIPPALGGMSTLTAAYFQTQDENANEVAVR